jgi:hypothetical protein
VAAQVEAATAGKNNFGARLQFDSDALMAGSGVPNPRGVPDQVINSDHFAVFNIVENIVHTRRKNEWINAKENVPRDRNYSKRSSGALSALLNVRNGSAKAVKTQTSREWFRDRNPVKLLTYPEFFPDSSAPLCRINRYEQ